jgi:hypothetical protein
MRRVSRKFGGEMAIGDYEPKYRLISREWLIAA